MNQPVRWRAFTDCLAAEVRTARHRGQVLAVILVDIRHFGIHNYRLGFDQGERIAAEVLTRLSRDLRKASAIERIAPDRIGVIIPDVPVPELLSVSADRLCREITTPFDAGEEGAAVEVALGIAVCPEHGDHAETLLSEAELALEQAGHSGSSWHIASRADSQRRLEAWHMEKDLGRALREEDLMLYYQPQLSLKRGCVCGAEALMRWATRDGRLLYPDQFIPLAESSGVIHGLTEWAVNTALREMADLLVEHPQLSVAVNVSASSIYDASLLLSMKSALAIWDVPPSCLVVEVTESSLMKNPELAFRNLAEMRDMGVRVSIDDFGTGFSSLAYLKSIPADEIKIDRSFVANMARDPGDTRLVQTIIGLSHSFGLSVVAEGVENRETLEMLREMDCDQIQGYLLGRPLTFSQYSQWVSDPEGPALS